MKSALSLQSCMDQKAFNFGAEFIYRPSGSDQSQQRRILFRCAGKEVRLINYYIALLHISVKHLGLTLSLSFSNLVLFVLFLADLFYGSNHSCGLVKSSELPRSSANEMVEK